VVAPVPSAPSISAAFASISACFSWLTCAACSSRPRAGSGYPCHARGNRRARSHTVWCPRSSSAGCTLPASPGRRGPAAPCGAPSTRAPGPGRHIRPVGTLIAPVDALPRSQGPVGCVGRVRSDLRIAPRSGRSPAAPPA